MSTAQELIAQLYAVADKGRAQQSAVFFKTGVGQYGFGDVFIGITVPRIRSVALRFVAMEFDEVLVCLEHDVHEVRFAATCILVEKMKQALVLNNGFVADEVFAFAMQYSCHLNNWDLVDNCARDVFGSYMLYADVRYMLYDLVYSDLLWHRRISIVATHAFILNGEFGDALRLCALLFNDKEDLLHKACGWMLREVGKQNESVLLSYLDRYCTVMPRVMLRYAIERFDSVTKQLYLLHT